MTTMTLPQVQVPSVFRTSKLFGRRAAQIVLSLAIALGLIFGLSMTTSVGTASAATGDSAPIYFGLGRAYTGENGLEIRLTRNGTELAYMASTVVGGVELKGTQLGAAALAKFGPIMQQIIKSGGIDTARKDVQIVGGLAGGTAEWGATKVIIPDGMCLGITYAPDTALLGTSTIATGFAPPMRQPYTKSWLEPCS